MKNTTFMAAVITVALLITACGPAATGVSASSTLPAETKSVVTESPVATEPAATEVSPTVANTPEATATSEVSVPVTGETTVKATLSDTYGPILVNGDGLALYAYNKDTQNGDTSACTDEECTSEWTALTTEGAPVAGAGAIQKLLGTITRQDGTTQVTYNGWPLYLYNGDKAAGSTNGRGLEGEWFLVAPSGSVIPE